MAEIELTVLVRNCKKLNFTKKRKYDNMGT
jgi:hypothetical protein